MRKKRAIFILFVVIGFLFEIAIVSNKTQAASIKKVCKVYKQYLAEHESTCKYFRVVNLKGNDVPVLMTAEEAETAYDSFGFRIMVTAYTYKNGKIKKMGNINVGKMLSYYQGSFYSLVVHGLEKGYVQNDKIALCSINTNYNLDTQSYESEIFLNTEEDGNYESEKITEVQNQNFIKAYQKSKQIKPYKNTKKGRKKCVINRILGKSYKETSELLITDKSLSIGDSYTLLIENKIKGAEYQWSSENEFIATVTQDGKIEAISEGDTIITYKVIKGKNSYLLKCKLYIIV